MTDNAPPTNLPNSPNLPIITVSTDGSCLVNPGGAWGWAWVDHNGSRFDAGGGASGTSQIAELTAVLEAIRSNPGPAPLLIEADSQYAIRCASEWLPGWKRKGWRTASGGPVKNLELVQAIDAAITARPGEVRFHWVRGHIGHKWNERADELAGIAARDWAAGRGEYRGSLFTAPVPVVGSAISDDATVTRAGAPSKSGPAAGHAPAHLARTATGNSATTPSDRGQAPASQVGEKLSHTSAPSGLPARGSLVNQILAPLRPAKIRKPKPDQRTLF